MDPGQGAVHAIYLQPILRTSMGEDIPQYAWVMATKYRYARAPHTRAPHPADIECPDDGENTATAAAEKAHGFRASPWR